ncbi:FkbM family methyltransferase [Chthonobacter rhizosphaerae]|uniref:FkbM family methyltransferase n=1 Tax=Chthonobacter rhizosphaerae TaxID=2735553 RepID=UPI0015EF4FD3|nr:FkbM family methyltransferase [Chthonobacter rhizosphaerae]
MTDRFPGRLVRRVEKLPGVSRAVGWWATDRNRRILCGPAAGLVINAGRSNPGYALGTVEWPVQRAIADRLGRGSVFFDVGANVGFFTILAARAVGPAGRVVAFEPSPANVHLLRRNISANGFPNVTVIEAAASDHSGSGELLLARLSGGSALSTADRPPDTTGSLSVRLVSLDDLVAGGGVRLPDVVKIDVEGAEEAVLKGMTGLLRRAAPVIVFEVDDADRARLDAKAEACQAVLRPFGYRFTPLADSYPGAGWHVANILAEPEAVR